MELCALGSIRRLTFFTEAITMQYRYQPPDV
jgi:hypothetical protein